MNYFRINNDQPITLPQCTKDSVVVEKSEAKRS